MWLNDADVSSDVRPTVSGMLAEAVGWRAIMWLCVGIAGLIEILFVTLFRETYHPTILKRRAAKKREETGDDSFVTEYDDEDNGAGSKLAQSMLRPARIVWGSTMLQLMSLWSGVIFAFFYVNSTSMPEILEVIYGFSPSKRGLCHLAWSEFPIGHVLQSLSQNSLHLHYRYWLSHRSRHLQSQYGFHLQEAWKTPWEVLP